MASKSSLFIRRRIHSVKQKPIAPPPKLFDTYRYRGSAPKGGHQKQPHINKLAVLGGDARQREIRLSAQRAQEKRAHEKRMAAFRYRHQPAVRYREYKRSAQKRHLNFTLTFQQCVKLFHSPCYYCNKTYTDRLMGIDRVNNNVGYEDTNVVPSCWQCNRMKHATSLYSFVTQCKRVATHQSQTKSTKSNMDIRSYFHAMPLRTKRQQQ